GAAPRARMRGAGARPRRADDPSFPGAAGGVPPARLDRLGAPAKRTAQFAAVLGRQFRHDDLSQLLAPEQIDVDRELAELTRRGVIHRKSLFSDDEYRFGESLTQEVAYDSLLLRQRRQLHERVAILLERGAADPTLLVRPSVIAHHYALSENRAKAVETLLQAAAEAERLPSFRTAVDLCRQAWELAEAALRERNGGDGQMRRWLMQATFGYARLTVLYGSSSDPDAERASVRGRELAIELGDQTVASTLRSMHGMLLASDPERFEEGVRLAEEAVEETRQAGSRPVEPGAPVQSLNSPNAEVRVLSASRAVMWHYTLDGRFEESLAKVEWMLAELERHGQRATPSDLYLSTRWMRDSVLFYRDEFAA